MACAFCATGTEGFTRNLLPGEMAQQLLAVSRDMDMRITNAVAMGQENRSSTIATPSMPCIFSTIPTPSTSVRGTLRCPHAVFWTAFANSGRKRSSSCLLSAYMPLVKTCETRLCLVATV